MSDPKILLEKYKLLQEARMLRLTLGMLGSPKADRIFLKALKRSNRRKKEFDRIANHE